MLVENMVKVLSNSKENMAFVLSMAGLDLRMQSLAAREFSVRKEACSQMPGVEQSR